MSQRLILSKPAGLSLLAVFLLIGSWFILRSSVITREIMGGKIIPHAPLVLAGLVILLGCLVSFLIKRYG